jgi:hypothetical protein
LRTSKLVLWFSPLPLFVSALDEGPEGSEGSTVKEGTSTVDLSAEDNGSTMNSGKADAQDGQNAGHQDAKFTQKKAADTTIALIKPSEPSGSSGLSFPFFYWRGQWFFLISYR